MDKMKDWTWPMFEEPPEKITLVRRLGSVEWIILPKDHTMSMGYLDAIDFYPVKSNDHD